MAQDKFRTTSPIIQIFKDGEQVTAKKLSTILEDTQEGIDILERNIGDISNYEMALSGVPLFQNSIGRPIGPMDRIILSPERKFAASQTLDSMNNGLIRWPYSIEAASSAGNKSMNLLPLFPQVDKIGTGCVADNGRICTSKFDNIYDREKNLIYNGKFDLELSGYAFSNTTVNNNLASITAGYRYNFLPYSEDFTRWIVAGPITVTPRVGLDPDGFSNLSRLTLTNITSSEASVALSGVSSLTSTNWCFSVYASKDVNPINIILDIGSGLYVSGSYQGGKVTNTSRWIVPVTDDINRYYLRTEFNSAVTAPIAKIRFNSNSLAQINSVNVWGAQLEPTTYPTNYIRTSGIALSGYIGTGYLAYTLATVPGHLYQITSRVTANTNTVTLLANNTSIATLPPGTGYNVFKAIADSTEFKISASGVGTTILSMFKIDPVTPCHALSCPGFTGYKKTKQYRAVLPNITIENHQFFGQKIDLPDTLVRSTISNLPTNILGIFDHEQNHAVPESLVDWKLTTWRPDNTANSLISDPEFLASWSVSGLDEFPTELGTSGLSGVISRDYTLALADGFPEQSELSVLNIPDLVWWFSPDTTLILSGATDNVLQWIPKYAEGGIPSVYTMGARISGIIKMGTDADGFPYVRIGPEGGLARGGAESSIFTPSSDFTLVAVQAPRIVGTTMTLLGDYDEPGGTDWVTLWGFNLHPSYVAIYHPDPITNSYAMGSGVLTGSASEYLNVKHLAIGGRWTPDAGTTWNGLSVFNNTDYSRAPVYATAGGPGTEGSALGGDSFGWRGTVNQDYNLYDVLYFDRKLTQAEIDTIELFLRGKYSMGFGASGAGNTVSQVLTDRASITASSGYFKGVTKTIQMNYGDVYAWTYTVQGNLSYAGVQEVYTIVSGAADLDLTAQGIFTPINGTRTNSYQVSGLVLPGEQTWSRLSNTNWQITRFIKPTTPSTTIRIAVGLNSQVNDSIIKLDSFNIEAVDAESTLFEYSTSPILGKSWAGTARHNLTENLLAFSDTPEIWTASGVVTGLGKIDPDGGPTAVRFTSSSGYIRQTIPASNLIDSTVSFNGYVRSDVSTSTTMYFNQGTSVKFVTVPLTQTWTYRSFTVSGLIPYTSDLLVNLFVSGEVDIWHPQIYHGSGVVSYVPTNGNPIRRYRSSLVTSWPLVQDWAPGYLLAEGNPLSNNLVSGTNSDGSIFYLQNTNGFSNQGVVRIRGQEYAYRTRTSGVLSDTIGAWRGTDYNPASLTSGSQAISVTLPSEVTAISGSYVFFNEILPFPDGAWQDRVNATYYNTRVQNLDRFSMQASSVVLSQAVGSLATSFIKHVADHRRHFRKNSLCALLADPSSWAAMPDIVVEASLIDSDILEIIESTSLNIIARRFLSTTNKEVTINWGDNTSTVITGTGNNWSSIEHSYDLKAINRIATYTIKVTVKDIDLNFAREALIPIRIYPADKGTQIARAGIKVPYSITQTAGTKLKASVAITQIAGTSIIIS